MSYEHITAPTITGVTAIHSRIEGHRESCPQKVRCVEGEGSCCLETAILVTWAQGKSAWVVFNVGNHEQRHHWRRHSVHTQAHTHDTSRPDELTYSDRSETLLISQTLIDLVSVLPRAARTSIACTTISVSELPKQQFFEPTTSIAHEEVKWTKV